MGDRRRDVLTEETSGGLPGFLGMEVVDVEPGKATARIEVGTHLLSSFGHLHGGVTAALVDHVLGAAVLGLITPGHWPATLELKINYLAPIQAGIVEASAQVLSSTRRTAVVRVDVRNGDRLTAAAQGTVMIVEPRRS